MPAAVEHQVLADDAARVGQAAAETIRLRVEQQPRRLGAVRADDDRLGALEELALCRASKYFTPVTRPRASVSILRTYEFGRISQRPVATATGNHRDERAGFRADLAAEAEAEAALHAGRPAGYGVDAIASGAGNAVQPSFGAPRLEQHSRGLRRMRRHRIRSRPRRIERPRRAGHADFPVDLRVVRLEILIGDGPVGEAGARDRPLHARFLEIDLAEAPEVRREVHARAADAAAVQHRGLRLAPCPSRSCGTCSARCANRSSASSG